MKKISIMITITIMLIVIHTFIYAASEISIGLSVMEKVKRGETVKITVSASNISNGNMSGLQGKIEYDTSIFEYVSNNILASGWFVSGFNKENGTFLAEIADLTNQDAYINQNKDILEITLKVKENAALKNVDVSLSNIVVSGENITSNKSITKTTQIIENTSDDDEKEDDKKDDKKDEKEDDKKDDKKDDSKDSSKDEPKEEQKQPQKLPYTGSGISAFAGALAIISVMSFFYLKYQKYKGI